MDTIIVMLENPQSLSPSYMYYNIAFLHPRRLSIVTSVFVFAFCQVLLAYPIAGYLLVLGMSW